MLIYVAGAYTGNVDENIVAARKVAIALWEKGHAVICPHLNSAHMEKDCKATWQDYLNGDFNIISRCDALVMVDNWKGSKGATMECAYATSLGIPIYYAPDLPDLHRTETTSPVQCEAFREVVGKMYRTHLSKNADYSPANILLTGETGLVTRLWDKTARLLNLTGFKFKYLMHEGIDPPKNPKNESIDDTYQDMAVYAVIGLLLRKGQWGR
jgi:nucleoside 2-deoxyribosyltransferase